MSINKVICAGNLTRDPELRMTKSGVAILNFGIAVNERRKNPSTGEWEDCPNFVDCSMFGKRAESVAKYLEKGAKVCIEGRLHYSSWEKEGKRYSKLDVNVDEIELMSKRDGEQRQAVQAPSFNDYSAVYDEDIPF